MGEVRKLRWNLDSDVRSEETQATLSRSGFEVEVYRFACVKPYARAANGPHQGSTVGHEVCFSVVSLFQMSSRWAAVEFAIIMPHSWLM
jgi:hypothetical protein